MGKLDSAGSRAEGVVESRIHGLEFSTKLQFLRWVSHAVRNEIPALTARITPDQSESLCMA
jgi:hypothetical protein